MRATGVVFALSCVALFLGGCGDTFVVAARVVRPARLPVRVFPLVYVVSEDDPDSEAVADRLATHLAADAGPMGARVLVRRTTSERLAARRASGRVERVSAVIRVRVDIDESERGERGIALLRCEVRFTPRCILGPHRTLDFVPTARARARLTVEDGPTGRVLQATALEARAEGSEPLPTRRRALRRLGRRARGLVDAGARVIDITLVEVDDAAARRALAALERGDWAGGASALARLVAAPGFAGRPRAQRAALLFDVGQAWRLADAGEVAALARLDRAVDAISAANRLDPRAIYADGVRAAERQRRDLALSTEQGDVAAHNLALVRVPATSVVPAVPDVPDAPEVPAAYRDASRDAGAPQ